MSGGDFQDGVNHVRDGGSSSDLKPGTPAHEGALHEEYQQIQRASRPMTSSSSGASSSGDGSQTLALLALPALYWPGLMMWRTWNYVAEQNPQWHPVYKFLPVLGELVGLFFLLSWFYRYVPRLLAATVTAAYFAFAYGYAAQNFASLDQQWTTGIALVAALIGFLLGRSFSEQP